MKKESPRKSWSPITAPADCAGDRDEGREHEVDPEHRAQDGANLVAARQPVGERAGRRLLERPEEDDDEQEQRRPEHGDEPVGLGAEHAGGEHVVGVGEHARTRPSLPRAAPRRRSSEALSGRAPSRWSD